jgi:membrane protease YdiL (CAAX protease family)
MVLLDSLLFAGASLPRIRSLAEEPFWFRLAIVIYSPLAEELVYRFIIMALLAWVAYALLSRVYHDALPIALWTGILGAATLFGLAHVGNAPNAPHPFLRAITLNGLAGTVFGWLYWKRGFEAAVPHAGVRMLRSAATPTQKRTRPMTHPIIRRLFTTILPSAGHAAPSPSKKHHQQNASGFA